MEQDKLITLNLKLKEVEQILNGLAKFPYIEVASIIHEIQSQTQRNLQPEPPMQGELDV